MWNSVVYDEDKSGPCSRSKHSVTLLGNHLYVLAGRNGNVPLKDFWRFDLGTRNLCTLPAHFVPYSVSKLACIYLKIHAYACEVTY